MSLRLMTKSHVLLLPLVFGLACNGPLPFFSGGVLAGEVAPTPADWSSFDEFAVVQLETRPSDPYSVNITATVLDGILYVNAGDTETQWVEHMNSNPLVRLRNLGVIYELRSERVVDAEEI